MSLLADLSPLETFIACAASTLSGEIIGHPLEVLKTLKQINSGRTSVNTGSITKELAVRVVKERDISIIYKGFSPSLCRAFQGQLLRFVLYDKFASFFEGNNNTGETTKHSTKLFASLCGSIVSQVTCNPWDLIRTRMITDTTGRYTSIAKSVRLVVEVDGAKEFGKGSTINIARGIALNTLDMALYQAFKEYFIKKYPSTDNSFNYKVPTMSAFCTSMITTTVAFPLDFMRVIFMHDASLGKAENRTFGRVWELYTSIYKVQGVRGYFNGFGLFFFRNWSYTQVMWLSFEYLKQFFKQRKATQY